jgi:hypothetical protein
MKLSNNEIEALCFAATSPLVCKIGDKATKNLFNDTIPGIRTYQKLEKKGLLFFTEDDVDDEGDYFSPQIELTEAGELLLAQLKTGELK